MNIIDKMRLHKHFWSIFLRLNFWNRQNLGAIQARTKKEGGFDKQGKKLDSRIFMQVL